MQGTVASQSQSRSRLTHALGAVAAVSVALCSAWAIIRFASKPRHESPHPAERLSPVAPQPSDSPQQRSAAPGPAAGTSALTLFATEIGRNAYEGRALLGSTRQTAGTYAAGALLASGHSVREIHPEFVVLERDGVRTRLDLSTSVSVDRNDDAPSYGVSSHEAVTDVMRLSPTYQGSALIGFRVFPGSDAARFDRLGLVSGDLLTVLNGETLSDPPRARTLLRALAEGATMHALLRRQGVIRELTLDGGVFGFDNSM